MAVLAASGASGLSTQRFSVKAAPHRRLQQILNSFVAPAETQGAAEKEVRHGKLKVIMIRHAESAENVAMAKTIVAHLAGETSQEEWLKGFRGSERQDPVELSDMGFRQANSLGSYWAQNPELKGATSISFFCSPYLRCCQTAAPLAKAMGTFPKVLPFWRETGGAGGHDMWAPGGNSAAELEKLFPGWDTSALPASGPWYQPDPAYKKRVIETQKTGEALKQEEGAIRAKEEIVEWLKAEFDKVPFGEEWTYVVVAHGAIIRLTIGELLGTDAGVTFRVDNTSVSSFVFESNSRRPIREGGSLVRRLEMVNNIAHLKEEDRSVAPDALMTSEMRRALVGGRMR